MSYIPLGKEGAEEYCDYNEFTVWAMESCIWQSDFDRSGY